MVTVGTSLFSSASWRCAGKLAKVKGYRLWTEELLDAPAQRRTEHADTASRIEKLLGEGEETTAEHFELSVDHPLRYSGELTTLIRAWQRWAEGEEDFAAFLRRRYARVELLASSNESSPSRVCARHLQVVLRDKLGHPRTALPQRLRSPHLEELVEQLGGYLAELSERETAVDLLVTGGYKAFSLLAGRFVARPTTGRSWQALYVHEDDLGQLIVEGRRTVEVGDREVWVSPVGEDP